MAQIRTAITYLIVLILSIAVHEFGHALVADRLGDRMPRMQGRVTLNPIAHIDPIGTLVLPLVIAFTGAPLLGWGRPVMTNPAAYTRRLRMKIGHLLVAAAGPAMNLLLALVVSAGFIVYVRATAGQPNHAVTSLADLLIQLNLTLLFFNLLPLPPLDGGTVLRGLLPDSAASFLDPLERYGMFILLALLMTGAIRHFLIPADYVISSWDSVVARLAG